MYEKTWKCFSLFSENQKNKRKRWNRLRRHFIITKLSEGRTIQKLKRHIKRENDSDIWTLRQARTHQVNVRLLKLDNVQNIVQYGRTLAASGFNRDTASPAGDVQRVLLKLIWLKQKKQIKVRSWQQRDVIIHRRQRASGCVIASLCREKDCSERKLPHEYVREDYREMLWVHRSTMDFV